MPLRPASLGPAMLAAVLAGCAPVGPPRVDVDCSRGGERLYQPARGAPQVVDCARGTVRPATRDEIVTLGRR